MCCMESVFFLREVLSVVEGLESTWHNEFRPRSLELAEWLDLVLLISANIASRITVSYDEDDLKMHIDDSLHFEADNRGNLCV